MWTGGQTFHSASLTVFRVNSLQSHNNMQGLYRQGPCPLCKLFSGHSLCAENNIFFVKLSREIVLNLSNKRCNVTV